MHPNCGKNSSMRPNEYETALVSRSPSIASLPLGQKGTLGQSDASISSSASVNIINNNSTSIIIPKIQNTHFRLD